MTINELVAFEKDRLLAEKRALERNVHSAPPGTLILILQSGFQLTENYTIGSTAEGWISPIIDLTI